MIKATILPAIVLLLAACSQNQNETVPGDSADTQPYAEISDESVIRVLGTEPFWGITIDGDQLTYTTPENQVGSTITVSRFAGRGGLSFNGTLDGVTLDLAVTPGTCSDGMSDHIYPFTATVQLGEQQLSGCAWREGEDDIGTGETTTADVA